MSKRARRKLASVVIGLVVAVAGGQLGWLVVKTWLLVSFESGAYTAAPEMALIIAGAVIPGVAATVFAWRALVGAPVVRTSWTLELSPRAAPPPSEEPAVRELVARLAADGYRVECWLTDEAAHRAGPASPEALLRGVFLELVESAGREEGRVVVRLPPVDDLADARGKPALGFVDVHGAVGGRYEALGAAAMAALRELLPEIRKL